MHAVPDLLPAPLIALFTGACGARLLLFVGAWLLPFVAGTAHAEEGLVRVTFEVNDAFVKDKTLPGVEIELARTKDGPAERSGMTGAEGRLEFEVAVGTWFVTYRRKDYVPILRSPTEIRADTRIVTTSLSMNLESEGKSGQHRIRIVLNWGSGPDQILDADGHVFCPCAMQTAHVFFQVMRHQGGDHEVMLDVDDRDGGGPETITLLPPTAGEYRYVVHDFSGSVSGIGGSDVVVRVLVDDEQSGEFRPPPDVDQRVWRPFRSVQVSRAGDVSILPFTEEELLKGEDRRIPPGIPVFSQRQTEPLQVSPPGGAAARPGARQGPLVAVILAGLLVVGLTAWAVNHARKRRG